MPLRASGESYRGINVVMLWLSGQLAGYDENTWMTYRQAVRRESRMKGVTPWVHE
jgi:antirestriction protein ArdC